MSDTQVGTIDLIDELTWRGLVKDCTDAEGLREHLNDPTNAPRKIYAGFDPTADSLTIGNLVPIMLLAHVKRAGHTPVVVMGGGTGLIGDPSGKSAERMMMTDEIVEQNVKSQEPIFANILGDEGTDYISLNNNDWLSKISYIEALRDIGKHFSVNMMMQKESVKDRLNNREQGISYTEFSYMILQAYDFAHLYEHEGVTVQLGGSDQYGNIVAGGDLIRRKMAVDDIVSSTRSLKKQLDEIWTWTNRSENRNIKFAAEEFEKTKKLSKENPNRSDKMSESLNNLLEVIRVKAPIEVVRLVEAVQEDLREHPKGFLNLMLSSFSFGLTAPLVAKADGGKFGKTETGAIWLTANRTSPYAYYQFWLNSSDEDAANWIKVFTFLGQPTVEGLLARHSEAPGKRALQRTLAQEATTILHGEDAMKNAEAAGKALFSGEISSLDAQTMLEVFASVPTTQHAKADLAEGVDMVEMLKACNLASSNREAKEFLNEGSVKINGEKIGIDTKLTAEHLLHGEFIAIRRGKKKWHMTKWA
ncbi:MAG: tyrosine--tRNA ligase [Phycisphaerales bacterium]|nr:tyrosine--tRNA ligase [Phycisphaerales bacterium]